MTLVGNAQVEWKGDEFSRDVLRAQKNGLNVGASMLLEIIKVRLSRLGTPSSKSGMDRYLLGASRARLRPLIVGARKAREDAIDTGERTAKGNLRRGPKSTVTLQSKVIKWLIKEGKFKTKGGARADAEYQAIGPDLVDPPGGSPRLRTGSLRRSIDKTTATPNEVLVGSSLEYARIHEIGGTIQSPGGQPYLPWLVKKLGRFVPISKEKAAGMSGVRYTKPHSVRMPARPYLRPSLTENSEAIATAMLNEMERTLAEGRK